MIHTDITLSIQKNFKVNDFKTVYYIHICQSGHVEDIDKDVIYTCVYIYIYMWWYIKCNFTSCCFFSYFILNTYYFIIRNFIN